MAMQFEVGHIMLRIDELGLFIHNTEDQGNIQLTPEEGNMFIKAWAMSQAALGAHMHMHGHVFGGPLQFMPPPEDDDGSDPQMSDT